MVARPKNGRMGWSKQNGNVFFYGFIEANVRGISTGECKAKKQVSGKLSK